MDHSDYELLKTEDLKLELELEVAYTRWLEAETDYQNLILKEHLTLWYIFYCTYIYVHYIHYLSQLGIILYYINILT